MTHVLTVGPTGYGKSQELLHVALQDASKGHGLCIINPKGDLIDEFLAKLPEDRWDDVIYINPAQESVPSINVLDPCTNGRMSLMQRENQKEIIVSDLIDLFRRQSENWGDQFGRTLETLLHAYLDLNLRNGDSYSLVDVYRSVINQDAITDLIDQTEDAIVQEQLVRIKEDMTAYELEPLQRRLNDFMMNAAIRRVIGGGDSGIDFRAAMDTQRIILVDVQKGEVGATVSELVGSIVLTKIWAAAQSRVTQSADERQPFYLFVDELQNFSGEGSNFAKILSEAREYRLGCWLATQYLHQLETALRRAVANNTGTKLLFNPSGSEDVHRLATMLRGIDKDTLTDLGRFRAAVQTPGETNQRTAQLIDTYPPWDADRAHVAQLKRRQAAVQSTQDIEITPSLGPGRNSGKQAHRNLLSTAKAHLEDRGMSVNLLYQEPGEDKPDGHVHLPNDDVAHLEAEQSTLSKPAKVLHNLRRAEENGRKCLFVVEEGNAEKLARIVSDPVNRAGRNDRREYRYYLDSQGEPITDLDWIEDAEYRILEVSEDGISIYEDPDDTNLEQDFKEVRGIDHTVLTCIKEGNDDVNLITSATKYENHEVNYSFEKLEQLGLITVGESKTVERVTSSGQKRTFDVKPAELTPKGETYFKWRNNGT